MNIETKNFKSTNFKGKVNFMNIKTKNIFSSFFYILTVASAGMSAVGYLYECAFLNVSTNFFLYDHIARDFILGFAEAFLILSVVVFMIVNKKKNRSIFAPAAALTATLVKNALMMFIDTWFQRGTMAFSVFAFAVFAVWAVFVGYMLVFEGKRS